MNKKRLTLIVLLLIGLLMPSSLFAKSFSDTKGHWAEKTIKYCVDKGYISGYPDGTFKPNKPITKAEYYTITNLTNPDKVNSEATAENTFKDVNEKDWFYEEVQKGILMGYVENDVEELNPNEAITREDAVRIFSFNKGWPANEGPLSRFTDKDLITQKYRGLVGAAVENKILSGYPDGTFKPQNSLTRAEVVTLIARSQGFKDTKPSPGPSGQWYWSFNNSRPNFTKGYGLIDRDKKIVADNFTPKDAQEIYKNSRNNWGGSCFGFAATSGLYKLGKIDVKGLNNPSKSNIGEILPQDNYLAQSKINIYQLSQMTSSYQNYRYNKAFAYNNKYVKDNTNDLRAFTNKLLSTIDTEKAKGSVVQLAIFAPRFGHAIVAYDYQKSGDLVKVMVYDPNFPESTNERFLEINLGSNQVKYNGSINASMPSKVLQILSMYIIPTVDYSKNFDLKGAVMQTIINLYSETPVTVTINGKSYTLDPNSKDAEKSMDGKSTTFILPEANGNINISGGGKVSLAVIRGESRQEINSENFTGAQVSEDKIVLNGSQNNVDIAITQDKVTDIFPQDTVRIKGPSSNNLTLEKDNQGYKLRAYTLKGLEVVGSKYYNDKSFKINADTSELNLRSKQGNFYAIDDKGLRYDDRYVNPDQVDRFVGSWHGKSTFRGFSESLDSYLYISKTKDGSYLVKQRSIMSDGSEYTTYSKAYYDKAYDVFVTHNSYQSENLTGFFKGKRPYNKGGQWVLSGNNLTSITFKNVGYTKY